MTKDMLHAIAALMMVIVSGCGMGLGSLGVSAPTSLTATSQSTQVVLTWNAVTKTGSTETITYNVYRATSSGTLSQKTKLTSGLTSPTYTDTTVTAGNSYYYQVTAVDSTGESQGSDQISVTISNDSSSFNLSATATSTPSVKLDWYTYTGATSYKVYRSLYSGTSPVTPLASGITATTYTDTSVTSGTTYYYKVTAITSTGSESTSSGEVKITP